MDNVTIVFGDGTAIEAERNGDCFITNEKPGFPDDLSTVTVTDAQTVYELRDAELIECASVDGRYWFTFRELSPMELRLRELEETNQMLTGCLLEMSELIYS